MSQDARPKRNAGEKDKKESKAIGVGVRRHSPARSNLHLGLGYCIDWVGLVTAVIQCNTIMLVNALLVPTQIINATVLFIVSDILGKYLKSF